MTTPTHTRTELSPDGWFVVQRLSEDVYAFLEPGHLEEPVSTLLLGEERAALVDTGTGIGDLRGAVEAVTDLPVLVVNTHTHIDHLGSNPGFDAVAMYDHPWARHVAAHGVPATQRQTEILADDLVTRALPSAAQAAPAALPPWPVTRWLLDGDRIDLGGRDLEVIHTPGEAPDHICLLDRSRRLLLSGDILLDGAVWAHLPGSDVVELAASYRRLAGHLDDFDHVLPSHNSTWLDKRLLPAALAGAELVASGAVDGEESTDMCGRPLVRYRLDGAEIYTAPGVREA